MKHCENVHTLDLDIILQFLSPYDIEKRMVIVRDLEYEYDYNLLDIVLVRSKSPMRSITLAMLIESIELYVRDFHDLLVLKQGERMDADVARKLVEILLTLNNNDTQKFKETYRNLFSSSIEKDIELVQDKRGVISKLLIQLLEGKRNEESGHSVSAAKAIAKRLYEAGEGTPGIDYDTFIKIFTHDPFSQLSAIFDTYEDKYGRPIHEAIENEFHSEIETECFQDMVEYTRSPCSYYSKRLRKAFDKTPIDYETLIRIIIGHDGRDLCEINLEYSKMYDETLNQTIENFIDIVTIKSLFIMILKNAHDSTINDNRQIHLDHVYDQIPASSEISSATTSSAQMRRNRSHETFDKLAHVLRIKRHH